MEPGGVWTNLQFYKTVDPFIVFFGFGLDQFLPQRFGQFNVSTGLSYHYNAGFSFAASEKTTLGFTLEGAFSSGIHVNGQYVSQSATEPALARLSLIQRVGKDTYLEPAISFGLNQDAPDFAVSLGLRHKF